MNSDRRMVTQACSVKKVNRVYRAFARSFYRSSRRIYVGHDFAEETDTMNIIFTLYGVTYI